MTFLQHCAERGIPVFVHPWDMAGSPRLDRWMARWLTGMPAETHLSIIALILGGVFDRVPPTLRLAFAHGGGSFAFWLGPLRERLAAAGPISSVVSERPPSAYLDRFSVDSVVFDPIALRVLVETLGTSQVMVGSDYPPTPWESGPSAASSTAPDFLDEAQKSAIRRDNALRFLGR